MTPLQKLEHRVWKTTQPKRWEKALRVLIAVFRIINQSRMKLFAASLTYSSLLAIVPLLAVLFTLLKSFGIDTFLQKILAEILAPMGSAGQEVGQYLLEFVNNAQTGLLGGVGLLFLFYSIFTLFRKIEVALNQIWHIYQLRSINHQLISYLGALMLTVIVAAFAIGGNVFFYQKFLPATTDNTLLTSLFTWGKSLLSILLTATLLAVIYSSVINVRVRFRAAFSGGLFCAILWIPLTAGFAALIAGSRNYSLIYSSFAAMIILLVWLHILWLLFLSGSLVAYFSQYPSLLRAYSSKQLNPAEQEYFANRLLHIIIDYFEQGRGAVRLSKLISETGLNHQQVLQLLTPFLLDNIILNVGGNSNTYLLAMDRQQVSDDFICRTIRGHVRGVASETVPEHLDNIENLTYTDRT